MASVLLQKYLKSDRIAVWNVAVLWTRNLTYRIVSVYYGFVPWFYAGETDHAGRAPVMPWVSPEYADIDLVSGGSRIFLIVQPPGPLSSDRRFNTGYPDSTRFFPGVVVPVGTGVQTGTHRGYIPRQCELGLTVVSLYM